MTFFEGRGHCVHRDVGLKVQLFTPAAPGQVWFHSSALGLLQFPLSAVGTQGHLFLERSQWNLVVHTIPER